MASAADPQKPALEGGTIALIVAAGRGRRLGGDLPKQYQPLGQKSLLFHTVSAFTRHPDVTAVRVVINPADRALYEASLESLDVNANKLLQPTLGGDERQDSVRLGLESLDELAPLKVLIHDGARPFATQALISRVIAALDTHAGAIAALPVTDTVKRQKTPNQTPALIDSTLTRDGLWQAQTPQGFRFADIIAAHRQAAGNQMTDDAAVAEAAGLDVALIEGSSDNFKITQATDFMRGEKLLNSRLNDVRVGQGFDVHQFGPAPKPDHHIMLCGLELAHDQAVIGHSDADVGLHAITDAILGALGSGDIGTYFPPTDPQWKGASSDRFLKHAADLVAKAGGFISHVDVTIICERPKVGPHRAAMTARIAEILALPTSRVSVKATTTEQLGFTGRREGIAAQAIATLRLP